MPGYDITVELELDAPGLDLDALEQLARLVMAGEDIAEGTGLAVVIVDDEEMRDLNAQFLGNDEPTDVLSFRMRATTSSRAAIPSPSSATSPFRCRRRSARPTPSGHPLAAEMAHLLVHGILHLCGHDHVNGGEGERPACASARSTTSAARGRFAAGWRRGRRSNRLHICSIIW